MTSAAFDTSALVKLVVEEKGSPTARELWGAAEPPVCCRLAYVEARAALAAGRRSHRLTHPQLTTAKRALNAVWQQAAVVEVTEALALDAADIAERRALRAYDTVHIAAARAAGAAAFVTVDEQQREAAIAERLVALDPASLATTERRDDLP
ncbi:MAG TPA: type II toxin-antitoxin system VapC family toxin [Candidatus Dormibacteraeota bacterium]